MSFNYEQSVWGRGEASLKWSSPTAFRLKQALAALLTSGPRVLEIGSGAGQFIRAVKKIRPELKCIGLDVSREAIEAAKGFQDGVEYVLSDGKKLPFEDESIDAVLIFDVLEHVEDPAGMLAEAGRVLKANGIFYCFVPCEGDATSLWNFLNKIHLKRELTKKYAGHINYFKRSELFRLLNNSGFRIGEVRYSEHISGQLLGVFAFWLMNRAAKRKRLSQINNESYFSGNSSGLKIVKDFVNAFIYMESRLMSKIPSPNVHVLARKK